MFLVTGTFGSPIKPQEQDFGECSALGEWYCGKSNCYEILGVEQNATLQEIRKAYRNISLTLHPDKNKAETAADGFGKVATAYEILTDNETRASYDYALAHPKEHLYNQYRFYRNRMYKEMKIPAQYTVTAVILIWSTVQYFTKEHMYQNAMNKIRKDPKYRARLRELLQEQQSASGKGRKQSGKARKLSDLTEGEKRDLEAEVDREVTVQGGRSKPALRDILVFQLLLLPWSLAKEIGRSLMS
ncbi:DnaJ homolog subfamily C member 25 [Coccomyxa sp. Obi]|nr:DnaJ homolog subfamily C member 25 [Coccomyxa sp. Obi]